MSENGINIVEFQEYILGHGALSKQVNRGDSQEDNIPFF